MKFHIHAAAQSCIKRLKRYLGVAVSKWNYQTAHLKEHKESAKPVVGAVVVTTAGIATILLVGPQLRAPLPRPIRYYDPIRDLVPRGVTIVCIVGLVVSMIMLSQFAQGLIRRYSPGRVKRVWMYSLVGFVFALGFSYLDSRTGLVDWWVVLRTLPTRVSPEYFFHILNAIGAIPTVFVVAAAVSMQDELWHSRNRHHPEKLRRLLNDTRLLLYMISFTLVVAVAEIYSVYNWLGSTVDPVWSVYTSRIAITAAGGLGVLYTIFLAAIFGPMLFDQRSVVREAAVKASESWHTFEDHNRWIAENGLTAGPGRYTSEVLAVLGPFLTGGVLPTLLTGIL